MKRITSTLLLLFISIILISCKSYTSIDSYVKELVEEGNFNGNVLVIENGKTLYEKSFGFTDGSKTTQLTKDYRFGVGSVYKEFPAVSIMQLQEKGLLNVDDKIDKYLKDLPSWASKISIKNLLQYTSGLPKVEWEKYLEKNEKITEEKIKKELLNIKELNFEPGEDYLYTNHSPQLLSKIIESITQQTFTEYVTQNIFTPFSLNTASIPSEVPLLNRKLIAIPFNESNEEDSWRVALPGIMFVLTANDLYQWLENLHTFKIINQESMKILSEEADFLGNIQAPLGHVEWEGNKIVEHSHHGESGNYECMVSRFNNGKDVLTIIVQANQKHKNVMEMADSIYNIIKAKK